MASTTARTSSLKTAGRAVVTSRRMAQPPLSVAEQSRADRHKRMMQRFQVLEERAQEEEVPPVPERKDRAQSASQAERRPSSYLPAHLRRPPGIRLQRLASRPTSSPVKRTSPPGAAEAIVQKTGSAELTVTMSHLSYLKVDVATWMATAADDAAVLDPKKPPQQTERAPSRPKKKSRSPLVSLQSNSPLHQPEVEKEFPQIFGAAEAAALRLREMNLAAGDALASHARAACILEGVRRSEASRRRISSREGMFRLPSGYPTKP